MKNNKKKKNCKASIRSMFRIAQISKHCINEILPKISTQEVKNKKKIEKIK